MTFVRKTVTAAAAALAISTGALATAGNAEAGPRRHYHGNSAGPVIAGIIGGLAVGALVASSSRRAYAQDYRYAPAYGGGYAYSGYDSGYYPVHRPAYVQHYGYQNREFGHDHSANCFVQKRRVYDQWGNYAGKRKVRVCQ